MNRKKNLFEALRPNVEYRPDQKFDDQFWAKFDSEFTSQKQARLYQRKWVVGVSSVFTVLVIALAVTNGPFMPKRADFAAELARKTRVLHQLNLDNPFGNAAMVPEGTVNPEAEPRFLHEVLEMPDLLSNLGLFTDFDEIPATVEEWRILLGGDMPDEIEIEVEADTQLWSLFNDDEKAYLRQMFNRLNEEDQEMAFLLMHNFDQLKRRNPEDERFNKLPETEQIRVIGNYAYWVSLEKTQQETILAGFKRFNELGVAERASALENYRRYKTLSGSKQRLLRQAYLQFSAQSKDIQEERLKELNNR